jgi:hypothetical protein
MPELTLQTLRPYCLRRSAALLAESEAAHGPHDVDGVLYQQAQVWADVADLLDAVLPDHRTHTGLVTVIEAGQRAGHTANQLATAVMRAILDWPSGIENETPLA